MWEDHSGAFTKRQMKILIASLFLTGPGYILVGMGMLYYNWYRERIEG